MKKILKFEGFDNIIPDQEIEIKGSELEDLKNQVNGKSPTVRGLYSDEPTKRATAAFELVKAVLEIATQSEVSSLKIHVKSVGQQGFEVDVQPAASLSDKKQTDSYARFLTVVRSHFPKASQAPAPLPDVSTHVKFTTPSRRAMVDLVHSLQVSAGM